MPLIGTPAHTQIIGEDGTTVIGTSANPWVTSANNDEDCLAAGLTALAALFVAAQWRSEREDAINKQNEVETELLDCFQADLDQYCNVDHPQQIKAIDTALNLPDCKIQCSSCIKDLTIEVGCLSDDSCTIDYANSKIKSGLASAANLDRKFAKQRYINCFTNKINLLIRATNLSFVDYSKAYAYFSNASTIQGSLAGMAAQGYGTAAGEFSYALGVLGRSGPNTVSSGNIGFGF